MKLRVLSWLLASILLTGCAQNAAENPSTDTPPASQEETTDTTAETFILTFEASTIDGTEVSSDCFADSKLTMLNVWATYCNPCLSEMPDLGEIASEYDTAEFQMFGIISDVAEGDEEEKIEEAKELITQTSANYPHLLLNQSLYSNLVGGVSGVPTTFFFNQSGELLGYLVGAQSKDTWIAIIEDLLSKME